MYRGGVTDLENFPKFCQFFMVASIMNHFPFPGFWRRGSNIYTRPTNSLLCWLCKTSSFLSQQCWRWQPNKNGKRSPAWTTDVRENDEEFGQKSGRRPLPKVDEKRRSWWRDFWEAHQKRTDWWGGFSKVDQEKQRRQGSTLCSIFLYSFPKDEIWPKTTDKNWPSISIHLGDNRWQK